MKFRLCRWRQQRSDGARATAATEAAEQAGELVEQAKETYEKAQALSKQASKIDSEIRAEIQRNRWTDTLFGVIETGRQ